MWARKYSRGLGVELHIAQVVAVAARPAAMHPGAFNQRGGRFGVEFVDGVEGAVGAAQIFGVIPAAHHQHRAVHVLHVAREVAGLPVSVVGVVLGLVVEEPVGAFQIELVEVGDVAGLKIELVAVRRAKVESGRWAWGSAAPSGDGRRRRSRSWPQSMKAPP